MTSRSAFVASVLSFRSDGPSDHEVLAFVNLLADTTFPPSACTINHITAHHHSRTTIGRPYKTHLGIQNCPSFPANRIDIARNSLPVLPLKGAPKLHHVASPRKGTVSIPYGTATEPQSHTNSHQQTRLAYSRVWHTVDLHASPLPLGRLASRIALTLMGKHKPIYNPSTDCGDYVVATNCAALKVTGKKSTQKMYYSHSTRPGSLKSMSLEQLMSKWGGGEVLRRAVRGMLPKNRLRDPRLARLKCFEGYAHPYKKNLVQYPGQGVEVVERESVVPAEPATITTASSSTTTTAP